MFIWAFSARVERPVAPEAAAEVVAEAVTCAEVDRIVVEAMTGSEERVDESTVEEASV